MQSDDMIEQLKQRIDLELSAISSSSDRLTSYAETVSTMHSQSPRNTMLIHLQNSDASNLAKFEEWAQRGRHVKKGEKGISIFEPTLTTTATRDDEGNLKKSTRIKFKISHVFDISQTDGEPYKVASKPNKDYDKLFQAIKKVSPYPIKFTSKENCLSRKNSDAIVIPLGLSDEEIVKSAILQLAQMSSAATATAPQLHAHTAAYIVLKSLRIECNDIAAKSSLLSGLSLKDLQKSLHEIQDTANQIINKLDDHLQELHKAIPAKLANTLSEKLDSAKAQVNNDFIKKGECKDGKDYDF